MAHKTLVIVRHAKSSWDFPNLRDFDRPLNNRGLLNAPDMGSRLRLRQVKPDIIISSPAKRAKATAELISDKVGFPKEKIFLNRSLYHADRSDILSIVRRIEDSHNTAMIFGHNPGFTEFANYLLMDGRIDNVPTSGVVALNLLISSWNEVTAKKANLFFFDYPKKLV